MRPLLTPAIALPALLLACSAARADAPQYDDRWYLSPGLEHISPPGKEGVSSGNGWHFALGTPLTPGWDLEFGVVDYSLDFDDGIGGSADHTFYGAQGLWLFAGRQREFSPFMLMGGGAHAQRVSDVESTKPYGAFGLGFTSAPWAWDGAMRIGLQYLHTFGNGNYNERLFSAGLMIPFGGAGARPTAPYTPPVLPPVSLFPSAATRAAPPIATSIAPPPAMHSPPRG